MPDAIITSTESTFGTISGTFSADQSTITGTVTGIITGTLSGSVGVPGPVGPGVPAGGLEGQIIVKASETDYDTVWADNSAETLTATVRNETGATLTKGTVVYINGAAGNKATVTKASAASESGSSKTFAILKDDIPNNQNGTAVTVGLLKGVDTSAFSPGANLWLSTTAGQITQTMPTSPNHAVFLGNAVRIHANQGEIEVRIQNGLELGELHDVLIHDVANGQVLKYDSAQGLWVNGTDSSGVAWGSITGTLSSQTDLQTALDGKYSTSNPAGYITSSALSPYLTSATAASTYQTISGMSSYLTTSAAASTYYPLTNPSGYITSSALAGYATESWVTAGFYPLSSNPAGYLTSASLSGYATESWVTGQLGSYLTTSAAASTYLTQSNAASTYQTIAGMSSYLTTASAASTYQTISGMSSYLTTSAAASTYLTQANAASTYFTIASAANKADLASPTFTGVPAAPTASPGTNTTQIATTAFVTAAVSASTGATWGSITGTLSSQTDLQSAIDAKLSTATAASTYQTLSGMSSYLTTSSAASTYQTISGMSSYLTTATAASTYAPLASPALTGNPTAPTPATADNDTSIATTAFVKAQGYLTSAPVTSVAGKTGAVTLVVGDVSGAAPLASPALTGTPTSPTAAAATNTTQIATTAFVQQEVPAASTTAAGKVELATNSEAHAQTSSTVANTPSTIPFALCSGMLSHLDFMSATAVSGSGALTYLPGFREMYLSSTAVGRSAFFLGGQSGTTYTVFGSNANEIRLNFSKKLWVSGRAAIGTNASYTGDSTNMALVTLGGYTTLTTGNMTSRGIGWRKAGGTSSVVELIVHNGTTFTAVSTTKTVAIREQFEYMIYSDGTGNVTLYIDGAQAATTSAGPTGSTADFGGIYREQVEQNSTATTRLSMHCYGGTLYSER